MTDIPITIGGETIAMPAIMNFAALKAAWPAIRTLGQTTNPIERMSAAVAIVAAALSRVRPELTTAELEARLATHELVGLISTLSPLFFASGLVTTASGETSPAEPHSTAISTR